MILANCMHARRETCALICTEGDCIGGPTLHPAVALARVLTPITLECTMTMLYLLNVIAQVSFGGCTAAACKGHNSQNAEVHHVAAFNLQAAGTLCLELRAYAAAIDVIDH